MKFWVIYELKYDFQKFDLIFSEFSEQKVHIGLTYRTSFSIHFQQLNYQT